MTSLRTGGRWLAPAMGLWCCVALSAHRAFGQIEFEPSWKPPTYDAVRSDVLDWLKAAESGDETAAEIRRLWPAEAPIEAGSAGLLDRVVDSLALGLPLAAELRQRCQSQYAGPPLPDATWLGQGEQLPLVRNNLRLYYARWLAQHRLYDEVLDQLTDLQPAAVVDPAALLFYRMAAHHQLVQPDEARAALVQLLEREAELPRRFQQVAQLVERDLSGLKDESLDHIARRMRDIRRRLGYGRAGDQVQTIEQGVVDSLDKLIEKAEEQAKQQQQQAQAGGAAPPTMPMKDSMPAELKAPMQVDRRDIGHQADWGDLPPKEREQAMQQVGREFPAHYRELIEQYFRELANEPAPPPRE